MSYWWHYRQSSANHQRTLSWPSGSILSTISCKSEMFWQACLVNLPFPFTHNMQVGLESRKTGCICGIANNCETKEYGYIYYETLCVRGCEIVTFTRCTCSALARQKSGIMHQFSWTSGPMSIIRYNPRKSRMVGKYVMCCAWFSPLYWSTYATLAFITHNIKWAEL